MKLAYSPASPYVRKVTACAIKRGIDKQIERMKISTTDPELLKYNALSLSLIHISEPTRP